MRYAHTVEQVRAAEAALMATVADGALMQRAAAGLAAACVSLLGQVYGARVLVLAGSGSNGGDALFAAAVGLAALSISGMPAIIANVTRSRFIWMNSFSTTAQKRWNVNRFI